MILVKLMGYCADSDDHSLSSFKDFYNNCDVLPLKMGDGLAGKTLHTYQPHFCTNIYKLSDNGGGVFELLYDNSECSSCFVICLRSAHTGDLDYAFEFFWPQSRNHLIVLESLLLTLKMCLPSFHFPSGTQLGDELHVVHVENSSFKILKGNELSQKTKASKETKVKFGDLYNYLYESQSHLNQVKQEPLTDINNKTNLDDDDDDLDVDDDVAIVALYKGNATLFFLPSPSTLAQAKEKMFQDFHLDPAGNYKLECEAKEGQWLNLDTDERLECFISYRRRIKKNHVKVRVRVLDK